MQELETTSADQPPAFPPGWARVELMGHVCYVGWFEEIEMLGQKMGRVTRFSDKQQFIFGGTSVYRITPMTEAQVVEASRSYYGYEPALPGSYTEIEVTEEEEEEETYV